MERLWAPWRFEYVRNPGGGCFLCTAYKAHDDIKALVVERKDKAFTIMNRFPYNTGHLMIAPVRHVGHLEQLDDSEILAVNHLISRAIKALNHAMKPQGYNIGVNQSSVAGAGVVDHIHFHLVPRWQGDTNFMPVLSETKVLSEALMQTYESIRDGLSRIDGLGEE